MKDFTKKHLFLIIVAIMMLTVFSYRNLLPVRFPSPDELADHIFSKEYAETGNFTYYEPLNEVAFGLIHTRNAATLNGYVYPVSFVGFSVVAGTLMRYVPGIEFFIVPLAGVLTALFIYLITRRLFDQKTAFLCGICTFFTAPLWYYSTSLFNNVLGLCFFTGGLYFFLRFQQDLDKPSAFLCGLFWSTAMLIRYTYAVYIIIPLIIAIPFALGRFKKLVTGLILFLLGLAVFAPIIVANSHTVIAADTVSTPESLERTDFAFKILKRVFFNIIQEFKPGSALLTNFKTHFFEIYFPFSLLFVIGLALFVWRERLLIRKNLPFFLFLLVFLFYLSYFYGNACCFYGWQAAESGLAFSYVRYWVILFIIATVFSLYAITSLNSKILTILFICFFIIFNAHMALNKGLLGTFEQANRYERMNKRITGITEPNAVIYAVRYDKMLAPDRKIAMILNEDPAQIVESMKNLIALNYPVYYVSDSVGPGITVINEVATNQSLLLSRVMENPSVYKVIPNV